MIEFHTDKERTKTARKAKLFVDRRSRYTISGHVFLKGDDVGPVREKVFQDNRARGGKCDICGKKLLQHEGDLEHIKGGRKLVRCFCYHQVLNDGTVCTNLRRSCSMRRPGSCHQQKHGRILKWRFADEKTPSNG